MRLIATEFQSTRPSRASTEFKNNFKGNPQISIHKALAGLDPEKPAQIYSFSKISIHKALAGLDTAKDG